MMIFRSDVGLPEGGFYHCNVETSEGKPQCGAPPFSASFAGANDVGIKV